MKKYIAAALAVLVLGGATAAFASEKLWGRVDKIDTTQNTITAWNGQLGTITVKVDSQTKLTQNGATITLGDVATGSHFDGTAEKQTDGSYTATELSFGTPANRPGNGNGNGNGNGDGQTCNGTGGRIDSIDTSTRTLSIWSAKLGNYKVTLTADAKITLNGKNSKLEDLKTGWMAWFTATKNSDGTYTATSINARDKAGNGKGNNGGGNHGGQRGGNGSGRGRH